MQEWNLMTAEGEVFYSTFCNIRMKEIVAAFRTEMDVEIIKTKTAA